MPKINDKRHFLLEVIVSSIADAVEAERGGADRLEVVRDLEHGGLTPELSLVHDIAHTVSLPLRVMLRESEDDSSRGNDAQLCAAAHELQQIGVDGVVIGFLRGEVIDLERTLRVLDAAPQLHATFHHAFDAARFPLDAITSLRGCGRIDRILSSGGPGELPVRARRLEQYRRDAGEDITILAGGNLDDASIRFLRSHTALCEFHVGRAARSPHCNAGVVRADLVKRLRDILSCSDSTILESTGCGGRQ